VFAEQLQSEKFNSQIMAAAVLSVLELSGKVEGCMCCAIYKMIRPAVAHHSSSTSIALTQQEALEATAAASCGHVMCVRVGVASCCGAGGKTWKTPRDC
jgi:hypothetical protein